MMNRIISLSSELLPSLASDSMSQLTAPVLNLLSKTENPDPDASRTVPELIESRGFRSETYQLSTEDGFILILHRIINPFVSNLPDFDSKPILLGHGIAAHAGHWLINSDDGHLDPSFLHDVLNQEAKKVRQEQLTQQQQQQQQQQQEKLYHEDEKENQDINKNQVNGIKRCQEQETKNNVSDNQEIKNKINCDNISNNKEMNSRRRKSRSSFSHGSLHERKRSSLPYKIPAGLMGCKTSSSQDLKTTNNLGFLLANLG